jgi:hypothetical protein
MAQSASRPAIKTGTARLAVQPAATRSRTVRSRSHPLCLRSGPCGSIGERASMRHRNYGQGIRGRHFGAKLQHRPNLAPGYVLLLLPAGPFAKRHSRSRRSYRWVLLRRLPPLALPLTMPPDAQCAVLGGSCRPSLSRTRQVRSRYPSAIVSELPVQSHGRN